MNQKGQVAAVVATRQSGRLYLMHGRFTFDTGWSDWARFANPLGDLAGGFDVAINSQGDALAAFTTTPCERTLLASGLSLSHCGTPVIYAVRF